MNRDWFDFKSLHGNIAGAREAFETSCESLFRKIHKDKNVHQVRVKQGDGGIDIFIGEFGIEPISVIQCKFFIEFFDDSQKGQVRKSFKTSIESKKYELKNWMLCVPIMFDVDQHAWWAGWKKRKLEEFSKPEEFIKLTTGNGLIDLFKEYGLYHEVFKITESILIKDTNLKLTKYIEESKKKDLCFEPPLEEKNKINKVLFNNYSPENEKYYLERNIDKSIVSDLTLSDIWVFGKSGTGKTTLINRNLIINKIDFIFCDMSSITISSVDQIFSEIIYEITDKFSCDLLPDNHNQIRLISKLLNTNKITDRFVIVIDELSIPKVSLLKAFADKIINLVNYYNNNFDNQYIRFIVSTIKEPKEIINNKEKASEYFSYLCSDNWGYSDSLSELLEIIIDEINLGYDSTLRKSIVSKSDNNPRLLKYIIRKILLNDPKDKLETLKFINTAVKEFYLL